VKHPLLTLLSIAIVVSVSAATENQAEESAAVTSPEALDFPVVSHPKDLTPLMERELRGCFDYFWNEWVSDPDSPTYGLHGGNYVGLVKNRRHAPLCFAEQGFYFAAIVVGVERGWITRQEGYDRILVTLKSIEKLPSKNGHYYHFIDPDTGLRGWNDAKAVELTNDDTATMLLGAIAASEYFGGEIAERVEAFYAKVNWKWFTNPQTHFPYLACYTDGPEGAPTEAIAKITNEEGFFLHWGFFGHHFHLFILAAGSPTPEFRTGDKGYYSMEADKASYGDGEEFIRARIGAAFNYQWTHCFIAFRNIEDKLGRNWFENSRHAAIAARQYAIDKADEIRGLGPNSWGLSACMAPPKSCDPNAIAYSGMYGSAPYNPFYKPEEDGTVAPYASSAFVVFTPKESIEALEYMYTIPGLVGKYGLYDAYSFKTCSDGVTPWIGKSYLGIDKGLVLPMFENYSSQLIWKLVHQNEHIQRGLKRLGFRRVNASK